MSDHAVRKIFLIAAREFRHTALTKSFIFGAIGLPLLSFGLIAIIPMLLLSQFTPLTGELAIVDPGGTVPTAMDAIIAERGEGQMNDKMEDALDEMGIDRGGILGNYAPNDEALAGMDLAPDITVRWVNDENQIDTLKEEAQNGTLMGLAVIPPELLSASADSYNDFSVELVVPNNSSPRHIAELRSLIREAVVLARVSASGKDISALRELLDEPSVNLLRINQAGDAREENVKLRMVIPGIFMLLIWIATFSSGNYLLTSTIEEKSNKVMEVVLSAVSPLQLLWGKIIGLAAVAMIILIMYGSLAIAALVALAFTDLLSVSILLWCGFFFMVAYFTIASIMAAVGSAVSDLREAQTLIGPVMIILMIPFLLWMPISENPNGTVAVVCSFLPPIQPFAMIMRLAASTEPIPTWQTTLGAIIGLLSVFGFVWTASRIFRVGVLMQGKPPSPIELLRWIRRA